MVDEKELNHEEQSPKKSEEVEGGSEFINTSSAKPVLAVGEEQKGLKFTVGMKLASGVVVVILIFMTIGIISYRNTAALIQNSKWTNHTHIVLESINSLVLELSNAETGQRGYLLTGEERYLEPYNASLRNIQSLIDKFRELTADNPKQQQNIDSVSSLVDEKLAELKETIELRKNKGFEQALAVVVTDKGKEAMDRIRKLIDKMKAEENQLLEKRAKASEESSNTTKMVILLGNLLAILFMGIVGTLLVRSIVIPLRNIVDKMSEIKRTGDLTQRVSVTTSDEIGILSKAFNEMQEGLYQIVSQLQQSTLKINTSSNQILAASNQQESTTKQQAAQMTQIQATLSEIAAASEELSRTAKEVTDFAQEASKSAQEGTQLSEEVGVKVGSLQESNKSVSDRLSALNEKIEDITKMLNTILAVADQTNLLSLNAAIEAAKAGEQGKGFSVVAQEIRRLADQTAQSSGEISNLIKEIQEASSSATMVMEKSSQDVAGSAELVIEFANKFSRIKEKVQNILPQVENISSTTTEQAAANKEIVSSVNQMADALKLTAASSKQTKQSVYDLTSMGQQLRTAVSRFKLK